MPGEARQALDKARQLIGPDERIALRRAQVSFYEGGAAALRAQLAGAAFDSSENLTTLLRAARLSLLLGDTSTARRLLNKGVRLAGAAASNLDFPWYERQGESGELTAAMVELAGGDRAAAQARLRALSARITQLQQAGLERFGLYTLLAQISSLRGDPSTAMRSLHKATDLGWRATAEAIYDPAYASLQSRSDFRSLVERLERETAPMRVQASRAADGRP